MSEDPLDYYCPTCWVGPGRACRVVGRGFHHERVETVEWALSSSPWKRSMAWQRSREGIAETTTRLTSGQRVAPVDSAERAT